MSRVVVLGGGFAGVLAASVLRPHAGEVLLIESDRYPVEPVPRRGVPQGHHSHVLVAGGAIALDDLLPGVLEELREHGVNRRNLPGQALMLMAEGWCRSHPTDAYLFSGSRGLLEHVVRTRALTGLGVSVWQDTRVLRLVGQPTKIAGVVVEHGAQRRELTITADLVVDATGSRSRARHWLGELGAATVDEVTYETGLAYATRFYQAPTELGDVMPAVMLHPRPDGAFPGRGATVYPIERGRWVVTLTTRYGRPPRREPDFLAFAESLRHPIVSELLAAATPIGPVRQYRNTVNRRRYFERVTLPDGFFAFGDSLATMNPVHSHGMSVAALGAQRIARELTRHSVEADLSAYLQSVVAEVVDQPWRMAISQDNQAVNGHRSQPVNRTTSTSLQVQVARDILTKPALAARFFAAQALLPADQAALGGSRPKGSAVPLSPLSADEAIAQHPMLDRWWRPTSSAAGHRRECGSSGISDRNADRATRPKR